MALNQNVIDTTNAILPLFGSGDESKWNEIANWLNGGGALDEVVAALTDVAEAPTTYTALAASPHRYRSGRYYGTPVSSVSTGSLTDGRMIVSPFPVVKTTALDRIAVDVTTLAAATVMRLGIYGSTANGDPGTLVVEAGTVDVSTTGNKELTIAQTLSPGLYWLAAVAQGGAPVVRVATGPIMAGDSSLSTAFTQTRCAYSVTGTSGALPSSPAYATIDSAFPRVLVRVV